MKVLSHLSICKFQWLKYMQRYIQLHTNSTCVKAIVHKFFPFNSVPMYAIISDMVLMEKRRGKTCVCSYTYTLSYFSHCTELFSIPISSISCNTLHYEEFPCKLFCSTTASWGEFPDPITKIKKLEHTTY